MLHPKDFEVNEVWIAFRINDAPIRTDRDGDFNCFVLMDAASCFILGMELTPVAAAEPSRAQFRKLLKNAQSHKNQLPETLFIAREDVADVMESEATGLNIEVVRVSAKELQIFTREARQAFAERFESSSR